MRPTRSIARRLRAFRLDERGALLVETAFVLPILIALMLGGIELARYVLVHQKMQRTATTVTDLVAREAILSESLLQTAIRASAHVMEPFDLGAQGLIIVSSVSQDQYGVVRVNWQRTGGGTGAFSSQVGQTGGKAALPDGLVIDAADDAVVTEVHYTYEPFFFGVVTGEHDLTHRAIFRPRGGALTAINN